MDIQTIVSLAVSIISIALVFYLRKKMSQKEIEELINEISTVSSLIRNILMNSNFAQKEKADIIAQIIAKSMVEAKKVNEDPNQTIVFIQQEMHDCGIDLTTEEFDTLIKLIKQLFITIKN